MRGLFNMDSPIMVVLGKMCDLLWLNLLTLLCCIPIVTAGASLTSLYYMTMKMVKNEEGYLTRNFFKTFKENFKQSTILWIGVLVIVGIFWADYRIYMYSGIDFPKIVIILFYALVLLFALTVIYIFPLQARFVNTCKGTVKNAFLLCITQLPKTILMIIIYIVPIVLFFFFPIILPLNLMFGFALPVYLASYLLVSIFKVIEERQLEKEMLEMEVVDTEEGEIEALETEEKR